MKYRINQENPRELAGSYTFDDSDMGCTLSLATTLRIDDSGNPVEDVTLMGYFSCGCGIDKILTLRADGDIVLHPVGSGVRGIKRKSDGSNKMKVVKG